MSHNKQIHKVYKILFESQIKLDDCKLRKDDSLHRIMDYDRFNLEIVIDLTLLYDLAKVHILGKQCRLFVLANVFEDLL